MTDRPVEAPSDESGEGSSKPVRVEERTVAAAVWEDWVASARSATAEGALWGAVASVIAAVVAAGVGFVFLSPSSASAGGLIFAPVVGWIAWSTTSRWARRRRFRVVAGQMRDLLVPGLLRAPSNDELQLLAARGHALLTNEYTVVRVEDRLPLYAIRVLEYAPERLPWGGGTESGFASGMG